MTARNSSTEFETKTGSRILVVEDDVPLANFLRRELEAESYRVDFAHDGQCAHDLLRQDKYDLVVLDLNLPKIDGVALLHLLRPAQPKIPVLVLTGRNRIEDRVLALNSGADDCLIKPFSFAELLARVGALLRRNSGTISKVSKVADLSLDREEFKVQRNGRRIDLSPREFAVLEFLMRNADRPMSRATIMEEVWNIPFDPSTNVVDVYIKYVRDKVDLDGEKRLIRTVRGIGYVLSDEA
jgi:DNA-binding response OmpR family regulator